MKPIAILEKLREKGVPIIKKNTNFKLLNSIVTKKFGPTRIILGKSEDWYINHSIATSEDKGFTFNI